MYVGVSRGKRIGHIPVSGIGYDGWLVRPLLLTTENLVPPKRAPQFSVSSLLLLAGIIALCIQLVTWCRYSDALRSMKAPPLIPAAHQWGPAIVASACAPVAFVLAISAIAVSISRRTDDRLTVTAFFCFSIACVVSLFFLPIPPQTTAVDVLGRMVVVLLCQAAMAIAEAWIRMRFLPRSPSGGPVLIASGAAYVFWWATVFFESR